jgi:hypothetical protein
VNRKVWIRFRPKREGFITESSLSSLTSRGERKKRDQEEIIWKGDDENEKCKTGSEIKIPRSP